MKCHGTGVGGWMVRCLSLLAMAWAFWAQGAVWHVRSGSAEGGDGRSWERSMGSLERALDVASSGDSIWIAGGIYEPTALRVMEGEASFGASFWLKDGVSVYGGFRGDERAPGERRLKADGLYGWEFEHPTVLRQRKDQLGSVLRVSDAGLSEGSELNGLVVEGGRALGCYEEGLGGGLYGHGRLTVVNCLFQKNLARNGGGLYWQGELVMMCTGLYDNDLVSEGWSGLGGGGMIEGEGYRLTGIICTGNGMSEGGVQSGGGLYLSGKGLAAHCTMVGNRTCRNGSGIWLAHGARLENSLVWGNTGRLSQVMLEGGSTATCGIECWSQEDRGDIPLLGENCGPGGCEVNDNWVDGYYPCFLSVPDRDFRLGGGSYGLNRGGTGSFDGLDALGVPLADSFPADLGACGSRLKGNLALDFSAEHPHLYGGESQLQIYYGMGSPAGIEIGFWGPERTVEVAEVTSGQWLATWLEADETEVSLQADVQGVEASYWHAFDLSKSLTVKPRPLLVSATDLEYRHGDGAPELSWSLAAGRLVFDDRLVGELECDHAGRLGSRVPITQGSLSVEDGRGGRNYHLSFLDGEMIYEKGLAELTVTGAEVPYDGRPLDLSVTTEPAGLVCSVTYEGRNGTAYGPSDAPPQHAGDYLAKIELRDDEYEGYREVPVTIKKVELLATAEDKRRRYGEENPPLTIRYEGFVGDDGVDSLEQPVASTAATRQSPVTEDGYEISVTGGQSRNYDLRPVSGRLVIGRGRPVLGAVTGGDIEYGEAVGSSPLTAAGGSVPGVFRWSHPEAMPGAGECVEQWVFTPDDGTNWESVEGTVSIRVHPRKVTVELGSQEQVYGDPVPEFSARIVSGSLIGSDRLEGRPLPSGGHEVGEHAVGGGTLRLGENYDLTVRPGTLRITARPVTLKATDQAKGVGEADPALRWQVVSGSLVGSDLPTGSLEREPGETEGSYRIGQGSLRLSGNYALTFLPGRLTITEVVPVLDGMVEAGELRYGDALSASALRGRVRHPHTGEELSGSFVWASPETRPSTGISRHRWHFLPAGDASRLSPLRGECEVSVVPAVLDVRVADTALSRPFFDVNPRFPLVYSGFVNGDDVSVLLLEPEAVTEARLTSPVGRYPVRIRGGLSQNYRFRYHDSELEVVKAVPVMFEEVQVRDLSYGVAYHPSMVSGSFVPPEPIGLVAGQLELPEFETGVVLGAGTYETSWRFVPANGNFEEAHGVVSFTVNKAPLTVRAHDVTLAIGDCPPASYAYDITGLVNGDDAPSLGLGPESVHVTCEVETTMYHRTFPIHVHVDSRPLENYDMVLEPGTLTVALFAPTAVGLETVTHYCGDEVKPLPTREGYEWRHNSTPEDVPVLEYYQREILVYEDRERRISGRGSHEQTAYFSGFAWPGEEPERVPGVLYLDVAGVNLGIGVRPNVPWRFVPEESFRGRYAEVTGTTTLNICRQVIEIFPPKLSYLRGNPPGEELLRNADWDCDSSGFTDDHLPMGTLFCHEFSDERADPRLYRPDETNMRDQLTWDFSDLTSQGSYEYTCAVNVFDIEARHRIQEIEWEDVLKPWEYMNESPIFQTKLINGEDHSSRSWKVEVKRVSASMGNSCKYAYVLPADKIVGGETMARYVFPEDTYPKHFYIGDLPVVDVLSRNIIYDGSIPRPEFEVKFSDTLTKDDVLGEPEYVDVSAKPGTYQISCGSLRMADPANKVTFCSGTLTIRRRPLTIRTGPVIKQQGEADVPPAYEIVQGSLLPGDELSGALSREPGEKLEFYKYTVGTLSHPCYEITLTADSYLAIVPDGGDDISVQGLCRGTLTYGEDLRSVVFEDTIRHRSTGEPVSGRMEFMRPTLRLPVGQHWEWGVFYPDHVKVSDAIPIHTLITVFPRELTVEASSHRVAWGDTLPVLTYTVSEPALAGGLRGELAAIRRDDWHYDIALGSLRGAEGCVLTLVPGAVVNVHRRHVVLEVVNSRKESGSPDPTFEYRIASGSLARGDSLSEVRFTREPGESVGQYSVTMSLAGTALDPELSHYDVELLPGVLEVVESASPEVPASSQHTKVVVHGAWGSDLGVGESVSWGGSTYAYGVNGFSSLESALEAVGQDGVILLTPGVYESVTGEWNIDRGISLIGDDGGNLDNEIILMGSLRTAAQGVSKLLLSNLSIITSDDHKPAVSLADNVGSVVIVNCRLIGEETALGTGGYGNGVSVIYSELTATGCCLRGMLREGQSPPLSPLTLVCNIFEGACVLDAPGFSVISSSNLHNGGSMDDLEH